MPFCKKKSGQSVVEFVIILPIILFVCIATISIGMFIYCKLLIVTASTQASKHGAYLYQVTDDPDDEAEIYDQIRSKALFYIDNGVPTPEGSYISVVVDLEDAVINSDGVDITVGRYCIVTVTYPFSFIFPLSDTLFGGDSTMPLTYSSKSLYLIHE